MRFLQGSKKILGVKCPKCPAQDKHSTNFLPFFLLLPFHPPSSSSLFYLPPLPLFFSSFLLHSPLPIYLFKILPYQEVDRLVPPFCYRNLNW